MYLSPNPLFKFYRHKYHSVCPRLALSSNILTSTTLIQDSFHLKAELCANGSLNGVKNFTVPSYLHQTRYFKESNHTPSSVTGVLGVTGTLSPGVESPFSSDLFRFFPGVAMVESVAGLYDITTLRKKKKTIINEHLK